MGYKSDIEIAQAAEMLPIEEVAAKLGLSRKEISLYGDYKAKIDLAKVKNIPDRKGKLILVTAISPTPAGEGKTTILRLVLGLMEPENQALALFLV